MEKINMRDILIRLLTPNDTLDVTLFNAHNKMHKDVKSKLLAYADFVVMHSISFIPGIEVEDILLNGSYASYFYHPKSNIDIKILVKNKSCDFLTKNDIDLVRFMDYMRKAAISNPDFKLNEKNIDIKFGTYQYELVGLYSLLNDKWIIEPKKEIVNTIDADKIYHEYEKKYYQIQNHLNEIEKSGEILTIKGLHNLEKYYTDLYKEGANSIENYIVFKLLKYRGVVKNIQQLYNKSLKNNLSIE